LPVEISALNRKLRVLIERNHFASLEEIASAFGVSLSTIQWWEHGDRGRAANQLPDGRLNRMIEIVGHCLDEEDASVVESLLQGPLADFKLAFELSERVSLDQLIAKEAGSTLSRIIPKHAMNLIETDEDQHLTPDHTVLAGEMFQVRLEETMGLPFALAFGRDRAGWRGLSSARNTHQKTITVPGQRLNGTPIFMGERTADTTLQLAVFECRSAPPAPVMAALRDQARLNPVLIWRLSAFYSAERPEQRRLYAVRVRTTGP